MCVTVSGTGSRNVATLIEDISSTQETKLSVLGTDCRDVVPKRLNMTQLVITTPHLLLQFARNTTINIPIIQLQFVIIITINTTHFPYLYLFKTNSAYYCCSLYIKVFNIIMKFLETLCIDYIRAICTSHEILTTNTSLFITNSHETLITNTPLFIINSCKIPILYIQPFFLYLRTNQYLLLLCKLLLIPLISCNFQYQSYLTHSH